MNEKEKREWTIEGLTQLKNIMYYSTMKGTNVYIESPVNFIEALDNALELIRRISYEWRRKRSN